ncbi:MAG: hypothetical protein LBB76_06835 [Azoarcus sp.]|jgi:hypothetical protein|nr:hypothetical protein [Azoarcus sp.]
MDEMADRSRFAEPGVDDENRGKEAGNADFDISDVILGHGDTSGPDGGACEQTIPDGEGMLGSIGELASHAGSAVLDALGEVFGNF